MKLLLAVTLLLAASVAVSGAPGGARYGSYGAYGGLGGGLQMPLSGESKYGLNAADMAARGQLLSQLGQPATSFGAGMYGSGQELSAETDLSSYNLGSSYGAASDSTLMYGSNVPSFSAGGAKSKFGAALPTIQSPAIVQTTVYENLGTVTRPMFGVASGPVSLPMQVNPTIVQAATYSTNPAIVQETQAVMQQAVETDTTTAPAQYANAQVNKQHIQQPILMPKVITQPIIQNRLIQQPIFRQHIVQQPIIRPIISQPVITPNYLEKTTIQTQLTEQPIIQPKVTEQTVVQPVLTEKAFQNQPITAAPVYGSKQGH